MWRQRQAVPQVFARLEGHSLACLRPEDSTETMRKRSAGVGTCSLANLPEVIYSTYAGVGVPLSVAGVKVVPVILGKIGNAWRSWNSGGGIPSRASRIGNAPYIHIYNLAYLPRLSTTA